MSLSRPASFNAFLSSGNRKMTTRIRPLLVTVFRLSVPLLACSWSVVYLRIYQDMLTQLIIVPK
jgi:hypothetical protein